MESRVGQIIIIITFFSVLSAIFLLLRLWTRVGIQHLRLATDDWIIIAAWVFTLTYGINVCLQTRYGLGMHLADLSPNTDFITSNILFYSKQPVYYVAVCLPRISIVFFYFRLFPQKTYRVVLWILLVLIALTGVVFSIVGIFQCNPISKAWDNSIPGTCFNRLAFFIVNGALNVTQDFVIYLLPSRILWNLKLPMKQRLALIAVFVVGGFVIVAGIVRLPTLSTASSSVDPTWDHFSSAIWSGIECNFAVICACLVHLKPLIISWAPSFLSITRSSKGGKKLKLGVTPGSLDMRTFGQNQNAWTRMSQSDTELGEMPENRTIIIATSDTEVSKNVLHDEQQLASPGRNQPTTIYTTRDYTVVYDTV